MLGLSILKLCFSREYLSSTSIFCLPSKNRKIQISLETLIYTLSLFNSNSSTIDLRINPHRIKNFRKFLKKFPIRTITNFGIAARNVTKHEYSEILKNFLIKKSFALKCVNPTRIQYLPRDSELLKVDYLYVDYGNWITRRTILDFSGKIAYFVKTNLKSEDAIELVKNWMRTDNRNLEAIWFQVNKSEFLDFDKVIRELNAKPWDPRIRGEQFEFRSVFVGVHIF